MKEYIDIREDDVPVWYEIGLNESNTGFIIRIRTEAMAEVIKFLTFEALIVKYFEEKYNYLPLFSSSLPFFIPPTEEKWGFGEVLEKKSENDVWVEFICLLPVVLSAEVAYHHTNEEGICDLIGIDFPYLRVSYVSATLNVLFQALWLFEGKAMNYGNKENKLQLLTINGMMTESGLHGSAFNVKLSRQFCRWLINMISEETVGRNIDISKSPTLDKIRNAMMDMHFQMWQKPYSRYDFHSYRVTCRPLKSIHLSCPGNACGLDPEWSHSKDHIGYALHPHNVDNRFQQLTLLAGVACLQDLARQDGY